MFKKDIENKSDREIIEKVITNEVYEFFVDFLPKLGFEEREGQQDMALDICEAMRDNQHIMVEAGVGIGKSYAYLLPLMIYNREFKEPVVVSTSTISLQEQLMDDIRAVSKKLGFSPEVVLAKGMSHFGCRLRVEEFGSKVLFEEDYEKTKVYNYLKNWVKDIGDRAKLNEDISEDIWESVNVKNCLFNKCKFYNECVFIDKRNKMGNTDGIILCNHDLLIVDAHKKIRKERALLSNRIKYITIDEAHNLEEKVRGVLQEELTYKKCFTIFNDSKFFMKRTGNSKEIEKINILIKDIDRYFKILANDINEQMKVGKFQGSEQSRFNINRHKVLNISRNIINTLDDVIKNIALVDIVNVSEFEYFNNLQDEILEDLKRIKEDIYNVVYESYDTLAWGEFNGKEADLLNVRLMIAPKFINKVIKKLFFREKENEFQLENLPKIILTSATLTNRFHGDLKERYSYIINNIGFPQEEKRGILSEPKESPFDYDNNTIVYYKNKMPHPMKSREAFLKEAIEEIIKLIKMTDGKTLILFASKEDLNWVYKELKKRKFSYKILKQNPYSSQENIMTAFKEEENSILLGTGIFWEGINIPGKTLSQVIVTRLPFPVPDPIIEFKRSISQNPLLEVNVPEMILKLRQGVGRLIRNSKDSGVVALLDPRVGEDMNLEYKEMIWNAIPMKNRTTDIKTVKKFIEDKVIKREDDIEIKSINDVSFKEFSTKKFFGEDNYINLKTIKCNKKFENGVLEIKKWISNNKNNTNPKTREIAVRMEKMIKSILCGIPLKNLEIEVNLQKLELLNISNGIEQIKRKLLIWKQKRIKIHEEDDILKLLKIFKIIRAEYYSDNLKYQCFVKEIKNKEEKQIIFENEVFKKIGKEVFTIDCLYEGELKGKSNTMKAVLFYYNEDTIQRLVEWGISCEIVLYEFEKDLIIKKNR
ncbi:ATP-dependent DNA helicase [Oceanirhabdus sp. W0125-5]|uniref:ATP-dependent DNA helicase n=1 Tax=Oceanirhabdus sp. W0125-5 TaxID=2999116 RepID=UPI0022F30395|nr:ATP-dependent DNA helicase [Oceanirhabdus sp. W0125-5]WBW99214.1 ATP-dependent DNA helicase [Oceanirhabdus sp. W0125-5]